MDHFTVLKSPYKRAAFILILTLTVVLTLITSLRYMIPLNGIPNPEVRRLDTNWFYEDNGGVSSLAPFPCHLDFSCDTLSLIHSLSDVTLYPNDVLTIQTRYQSIRVWADQTLIYEAAQGKDYALSSMWHFIPLEKYGDASTLRVELKKYDQSSSWEFSSVFLDHPKAISMHLLRSYAPAIVIWLFCMLLTLLLLFIILFMAIRKIAGIPLLFALTSFIFLSGTWILLDSKITTIIGGNYALAYFFSYCVFYLLPVPLLFYFQLILKLKSRFLRYLTWFAVANAGLWMLLHLLGVVSIQKTATSVHLIIIIFLVMFIREFFQTSKRLQRKRLICSSLGIFVIFAVALISIILYYAGLLPPTNSALLYVWGLFALIFCMIMDTVIVFGRIWKEQQYTEVYRQLATKDSMTQIANRNAYELRLHELQSHPPAEMSFIIFDIDKMKYINDTYGHHVGDLAIFLTAQCISEVFGSFGDCYRIGGDEFCVILTSSQNISEKLLQFDALIKTRNNHALVLNVSHGWANRTFQAGTPITIEDIFALKTVADQNLYRNKADIRK